MELGEGLEEQSMCLKEEREGGHRSTSELSIKCSCCSSEVYSLLRDLSLKAGRQICHLLAVHQRSVFRERAFEHGGFI